eukprot:1183345-Prorocentrum_minimum.AAC.3
MQLSRLSRLPQLISWVCSAKPLVNLAEHSGLGPPVRSGCWSLHASASRSWSSSTRGLADDVDQLNREFESIFGEASEAGASHLGGIFQPSPLRFTLLDSTGF